MTIVVLAWGSLCWDPRELPISREHRAAGDWHIDGPILPIEFARVSASRMGSLTLVLRRRSKKVRVLWAEMNTATLDKAIENLAKVEGTSEDRIGWVDKHNPSNNNCRAFRTGLVVIKRWARRKHFDAVVWTALESNFCEKTKMKLNGDNAVKYLKSLHGEASQMAEEYVRNAPRQIRTRTRRVIVQKLRWTHIGDL